MIEYDGFNWCIHKTENNTIVRSVYVGENGKIYVGAQGDFGFFSPNNQGELIYQSLKNQLDLKALNFGDIWDIIELNGGLFFRSDKKIFHQKGDELQVFEFDVSLLFTGIIFGELFIQDSENQFFKFENNEFRPVHGAYQNIKGEMAESLAFHPDTTLLITNQNGIFYVTENSSGRWSTPFDEIIKNESIFSASLLPNNMIALGSTNNGIYILDENRRIHQHLNKKNGLQNNTVLKIFTDKVGDLWLGLDNGIDYVKTSSPFSTIYPDGELEGTGYAMAKYDDVLFFGTNTGLYSIPFKDYYSPNEKSSFSLVPGSEGQVWSLEVLEGELLVGHHKGAFSFRENELKRLTDFSGVWRFISLKKNRAIGGHYEGLALFEKNGGSWEFVKKYEGFKESSRLLAPESVNGLWMAHPYRGVFKVDFLEDEKIRVDILDEERGLPTDFGNLLFNLNGRPTFVTEKGVYLFDPKEKSFFPPESFNGAFAEEEKVSYLRQDEKGNIWFVSGDKVGVLLVKDDLLEKKIERLDFPELNGQPMNGFEFIFPLDEKNIFLATEQGFKYFNLNDFPEKNHPIEVVLQEVTLLESDGDSLLFGGHLTNDSSLPQLHLSHLQNNLRLSFGATDYHGKEFIEFAHRTDEGEKWSDWTKDNRLIFNNLRHGEYHFEVKARTKGGLESQVLYYPFRIDPPWYASTFAKVAYWVLLFGIFLIYMFRQKRNFETEKAELESSHQKIQAEQELKVRQSAEIINQLEKEKLENEVHFKNQQLASATMNLVQKNEFLSSIMDALKKMNGKSNLDSESKKEIKRIVRLIESDANMQEDWKNFTLHFDQVHRDFLGKLGEQFPQLSPNDFKLSAYLRMNLSSKEIATLMNISVRGVEASRYRLRKKLGISKEVNLTEFMMKL